MATHLPQNQFISNSGAHVPIASGSAADSPLPPSKSAAASSVSMASSAGAMETEAAVGAIPAASDNIDVLVWDINSTDLIHEVFVAESRFTPDFTALYQATIDDDPLPLFLQRDAE